MNHLSKIVFLVLALVLSCSVCLHGGDAKKEPSPPRRLSELPEKYQEAAKAVAAVLVSEKEDPKEFRATVKEEDGKLWVFQLWHVSAFTAIREAKEKGLYILGNPGDRCRNIVYDVKTRTASGSRFWQ